MAVTEPLTLLYRGPLSSCNYACTYCPFGKRRETAAELALDRTALERFVGHVLERGAPTGVLFTPWGEALVRPWYREAIARLSRAPHVKKVAIQTNLHAPLAFLDAADISKVGLWCTYHPGETTLGRFLERAARLEAYGASFSVGVVGLRAHFDAIETLRAALPPHRYLWVNAYKREPDYYRSEDVARLIRVDPHFATNLRPHQSLGRPCRTGRSVFSVDGQGTVRRCHFVPQRLGNLYDGTLRRATSDLPCPNASCGCHIGYVHLVALGLDALYGPGLLERALPSASGETAPALDGRGEDRAVPPRSGATVSAVREDRKRKSMSLAATQLEGDGGATRTRRAAIVEAP